MKHYHGTHKRHSYFEGWYFKHHGEKNTLAVIPGVQFDEVGRHAAFIQVITEEDAYYIPYPFSSFRADTKKLDIQIGENRFTEKGIKLFIDTPQLCLKGALYYGHFSPLRYDIMGPFCKLPLMECKHGILSMSHQITGCLTLNGENLSFLDGRGYIEKDWGHSFPKSYLWTHCNHFPGINCSIMASVADIPFLGLSFKGCICSIYYEGQEYRLATYLGVKVTAYSDTELTLLQPPYTLQVLFKDNHPKPLKAPHLGTMKRTIHESPVATVSYRFFMNDQLIFDLESSRASFEMVNNDKRAMI